MNTVSRTISGGAIFTFGVVLVFQTVRESADIWSVLIAAAAGLFCVGVGVYLFFHTREDDIEPIKNNKTEIE